MQPRKRKIDDDDDDDDVVETNPSKRQKFKREDLDLIASHASALRLKCQDVFEAAQPVGFDSGVLQAKIETAQTYLKGLEQLVWPFEENDSAAQIYTPTREVQAVFELPELVEEICIRLHPFNVLRLQQTCKSLRDIIQTSTKLQRHLFLAAHQEQGYRVLVPENGSDERLSFGVDLRLYDESDSCDMRYVVLFNYGSLTLGGRVQQMRISHPPICSLQYSASCCGERTFYSGIHKGGETRVVANSQGLTLGDLLKAAKEMMTDHKLCINAAEWEHEQDGFVRPDIHFKCNLRLNADDPMLLKAKRDGEAQMKFGKGYHMMRSYRSAKQAAHNQGLPIPTLDEFEASRAMAELA